MNPLSNDVRTECLFLARKTLHAHVRRQQAGDAYRPAHPELELPCGAFVTLKRGGELRGCIGYVEAVKPLWETIADCTVSAASHDPRFPPVAPDELAAIIIEISVLSPMRDVADPADIAVGRDGLLISTGFRRGLLLPQVATEYGWDREEFLRHTCRKAGLPDDAWRKGARIQAFTADVFGESEA
ncbi:MAG TPA: AmmeMemoRadiSam system protein A [Acidobacteriota bacterium]|nr:AmmeMemoRadiSam system protein A [Acidobacteriota bacterium]HNU01414.1 AmmeMemoRadiSam system protein A [Acidobacteriota bacterium]